MDVNKKDEMLLGNVNINLEDEKCIKSSMHLILVPVKSWSN